MAGGKTHDFAASGIVVVNQAEWMEIALLVERIKRAVVNAFSATGIAHVVRHDIDHEVLAS